MLNVVWFGGALLLFGTCFADPQNPSILVTSGGYPSNVLTLTVNTKKYVHTISDRFLSITLEPAAIFSVVQRNLGFVFVVCVSLGQTFARFCVKCGFYFILYTERSASIWLEV